MKKPLVIAAILILTLILCLAAIGIGYAKWTGQINLTAGVTTADNFTVPE